MTVHLEIGQRGRKFVQLLLRLLVLLGHFFVLGFPLVPGLLKSLDLAFVVAGFDVGLAEPGKGGVSPVLL